jgi:uncharacterized protein
MTRIRYLILVAIVFLNVVGKAQTTEQRDSTFYESIKVLARVSQDSVQLRWAPINFSVWKQSLTTGYVVDKYVIARDEELLPKPEVVRLTENPMKVWSEERWESLVNECSFAANAAQAIYGAEFESKISENDFVAIANRSQENDQRFYFALYSADLSIAVARAQGLYLVDRSIKNTERYLYKVSIFTESDTLSGSIFVAGDEVNGLLEPPANLQLECENSQANLRWDAPLLTRYATYRIERAVDMQAFKPIGDHSLVTLTPKNDALNNYEYFVDSIQVETHYSYQVVGQSIFGERSLPSESKNCKISSRSDLTVRVVNGLSFDNESIQIEWACEENSNIKGFLINRAVADNGVYKPLNHLAPLSPNQRVYVDLKPERSNYYKVSALGEGGIIFHSQSFFVALIDSIPPSPPDELQGEVDQFGKIKIKWKDLGESDLYGYRIYIANNRAEEMSQATSKPIPDRTYEFTRAVATLNDSLFIAVAAVDNNQNQSTMSEIFALGLPDLTRPTAPIILQPKHDSTGVVISWIKSSSVDVVEYDLYRRGSVGSHWIRIKKVPADGKSEFEFLDSTIPEGTPFFYCVMAIDDTGLESLKSSVVEAKKFPVGLRPSISWKPQRNIENKKILLQWSYAEKKLAFFKIYKAVDDGSMALYKTLGATVNEFLDDYQEHVKCKYQIVVFFSDGTKSRLSEILQLN